MSAPILVLMPDQPDLPFGVTYQCTICGTRVRPGQPHTAESPRPHQTYEALITISLDDSEASQYTNDSGGGEPTLGTVVVSGGAQ